MGKHDWKQVWSSRSPTEVSGSVLGGLLESDGYDSPRARMSEAAWRSHIAGWADLLGLGPGNSVFEVGCGAGAALYVLAEIGVLVSGIDQAPSLVERAAKSIPAGDFVVGDALDFPTEPLADACVAVGVFFYFPSLEYAAKVVSRMATKASRAVAILDLPDQAKKDESQRFREEMAGGPAAYEEHYSGLDHLYFDRMATEQVLRDCGLVGVQSADQELDGYPNARFRFNCWGFQPD